MSELADEPVLETGAIACRFKSCHPHQKIRQVSTCRIFLSKPQAWHIITARSVVHIISPFGAVSHHALACIYLRLDDIQHFVLVICNSCGIDDIHGYAVIWYMWASDGSGSEWSAGGTPEPRPGLLRRAGRIPPSPPRKRGTCMQAEFP